MMKSTVQHIENDMTDQLRRISIVLNYHNEKHECVLPLLEWSEAVQFLSQDFTKKSKEIIKILNSNARRKTTRVDCYKARKVNK